MTDLATIVDRQITVLHNLKICADPCSERTLLQCFERNQKDFRDNGYGAEANVFLLSLGIYFQQTISGKFEDWKTEEERPHNVKNIRPVSYLGKQYLFAEDMDNSTKAVKLGEYVFHGIFDGNVVYNHIDNHRRKNVYKFVPKEKVFA